MTRRSLQYDSPIAEPTTQFLNDLLKLGAQQMYDFYLSEINKKMVVMENEEAANYANILIEHYSKQPDPDQAKIVSDFQKSFFFKTSLS